MGDAKPPKTSPPTRIRIGERPLPGAGPAGDRGQVEAESHPSHRPNRSCCLTLPPIGRRQSRCIDSERLCTGVTSESASAPCSIGIIGGPRLKRPTARDGLLQLLKRSHLAIHRRGQSVSPDRRTATRAAATSSRRCLRVRCRARRCSSAAPPCTPVLVGRASVQGRSRGGSPSRRDGGRHPTDPSERRRGHEDCTASGQGCRDLSGGPVEDHVGITNDHSLSRPSPPHPAGGGAPSESCRITDNERLPGRRVNASRVEAICCTSGAASETRRRDRSTTRLPTFMTRSGPTRTVGASGVDGLERAALRPRASEWAEAGRRDGPGRTPARVARRHRTPRAAPPPSRYPRQRPLLPAPCTGASGA
jgi:hypothetical protein